jgi:hypothetical protein
MFCKNTVFIKNVLHEHCLLRIDSLYPSRRFHNIIREEYEYEKQIIEERLRGKAHYSG